MLDGAIADFGTWHFFWAANAENPQLLEFPCISVAQLSKLDPCVILFLNDVAVHACWAVEEGYQCREHVLDMLVKCIIANEFYRVGFVTCMETMLKFNG